MCTWVCSSPCTEINIKGRATCSACSHAGHTPGLQSLRSDFLFYLGPTGHEFLSFSEIPKSISGPPSQNSGFWLLAGMARGVACLGSISALVQYFCFGIVMPCEHALPRTPASAPWSVKDPELATILSLTWTLVLCPWHSSPVQGRIKDTWSSWSASSQVSILSHSKYSLPRITASDLWPSFPAWDQSGLWSAEGHQQDTLQEPQIQSSVLMQLIEEASMGHLSCWFPSQSCVGGAPRCWEYLS